MEDEARTTLVRRASGGGGIEASSSTSTFLRVSVLNVGEGKDKG